MYILCQVVIVQRKKKAKRVENDVREEAAVADGAVKEASLKQGI